jgi:hypothetical protein
LVLQNVTRFVTRVAKIEIIKGYGYKFENRQKLVLSHFENAFCDKIFANWANVNVQNVQNVQTFIKTVQIIQEFF